MAHRAAPGQAAGTGQERPRTGTDRSDRAGQGEHSIQGRTRLSGGQVPVRISQGQVSRTGQERRADDHAVCAGQPVAGARQTAGAAGMSAPEMAQQGQFQALSGRKSTQSGDRTDRNRPNPSTSGLLAHLKVICAGFS